MKECFKCHETKELGEFYNHPTMLDGKLGKCKDCTKSDVRNNYTQKSDRYRAYDKMRQRNDLKRIYSHRYNQIRARVGGYASRVYRVQGKEMLSREEFVKWCDDNQDEFDKLYIEWKKSNFERGLSPSIDRKDNNLGYIASNMQWLSLKDNISKGTK